MKRRSNVQNFRGVVFGCPRIAQQIAFTFEIEINKDVVRRILAQHYRPESGKCGPSGLSVIGAVKDQLWSLDLFRCESIHLFVEPLIGTIRREHLDRVLFWNRGDLERKLACFTDYYNRIRVHASLGGKPPLLEGGGPSPPRAELER